MDVRFEIGANTTTRVEIKISVNGDDTYVSKPGMVQFMQTGTHLQTDLNLPSSSMVSLNITGLKGALIHEHPACQLHSGNHKLQ